MSAPPPFAVSDARWLAHRYHLPTDGFLFRLTERSAHAAVPFLTDEYLGESSVPVVELDRQATLAQMPGGRLHFLFHSAFCNSTLLCRALDIPGVSMGLSEPVILNDMVGVRRRREVEGRKLGELTDSVLKLLARPWSANEAVIVKPSNILNPLAAGLMTLRPDAQALLLYAPLEAFLNSVARKGLWCRLWVRELLEGLLTENVVDFGFTPQDFFRQSDLQVAAVGWLAQHRLFHQIASNFGPRRVLSLNSDALQRNPHASLSAIARHFDLSIGDEKVAAIVDGPTFHRHSKSGAAFSMAQRQAEQASTAAAHADEISKVTLWARTVAEQSDIALDLPNPVYE
jgi:hypothetical protein